MAASKLVKISRDGERFWVRDVRALEPNAFIGVVANSITNSVLSLGDKIAFVAAEIVEIADEYPKPHLTLVEQLDPENSSFKVRQ